MTEEQVEKTFAPFLPFLSPTAIAISQAFVFEKNKNPGIENNWLLMSSFIVGN